MKPPPPNALVNKFIALSLVFLLFSGTLGLGAVWVRQEIFSAANRSRVIELQVADVERKLDEVGARIATAEGVAALLERNDTLALGLHRASREQVVRLDRDPVLALTTKRGREAYFNGARGSGTLFAFNLGNAAAPLR